MVNKYLTILAIMAFGSSICAGLRERLVIKNEAINTVKDSVRTGKPVVLSNECKVRTCKFRCKT
jgi:hypothetical protein